MDKYLYGKSARHYEVHVGVHQKKCFRLKLFLKELIPILKKIFPNLRTVGPRFLVPGKNPCTYSNVPNKRACTFISGLEYLEKRTS